MCKVLNYKAPLWRNELDSWQSHKPNKRITQSIRQHAVHDLDPLTYRWKVVGDQWIGIGSWIARASTTYPATPGQPGRYSANLRSTPRSSWGLGHHNQISRVRPSNFKLQTSDFWLRTWSVNITVRCSDSTPSSPSVLAWASCRPPALSHGIFHHMQTAETLLKIFHGWKPKHGAPSHFSMVHVIFSKKRLRHKKFLLQTLQPRYRKGYCNLLSSNA